MFTQETSLSKDAYVAKAKKQNTAGWVILGTGFTISTIGLIVEMNEVTTELASIIILEPRDEKSAGGALLIAGSIVMASSLPLFIASSKNRKRAATAFIKMESQHELKNASFVTSSFPALALKISF